MDQTILERGSELAADGARVVRESVSAATREISDLAGPAAGRILGVVRAWTRENPELGLCGAMGVGLVIGLMLGRRD